MEPWELHNVLNRVNRIQDKLGSALNGLSDVSLELHCHNPDRDGGVLLLDSASVLAQAKTSTYEILEKVKVLRLELETKLKEKG